MNTVLWIFQGLLAMVLLLSGSQKFLLSKEQLAVTMPVYGNTSCFFVQALGWFELVAGFGITVPQLVSGHSFLTPLFAMVIASQMLVASIVYVKRKEPEMLLLTISLFICAGIIAFFRMPWLNLTI